MSCHDLKYPGPWVSPDPKSFVAVVTIPKAEAEVVAKTFGHLCHNEGWSSKFVGFPSAETARAIGAI